MDDELPSIAAARTRRSTVFPSAHRSRAGERLPLTIRLFGSLHLSRGTHALPGFPTRKSKALFAYLVLHRDRLHSRGALIGTLYGDQPEKVALKCLRMELWRVREVLEQGGTRPGCPLIIRDHDVGFNPASPHWLDLAEFESRIAASGGETMPCRTPAAAQALHDAAAIYRGDVLEGVYDEWCVYPRERFKRKLRAALDRLMRYHGARGEWSAAIACGLRLLESDSLLEHVYRHLMHYHCASGDRPAALRVFRECERVLRDELQVEPMVETQALHHAIRTGREAPCPDAETIW